MILDPNPDPHDRFFRESFGRREIARDFLQHHLPAALLAESDLDSPAIALLRWSERVLTAQSLDGVFG